MSSDYHWQADQAAIVWRRIDLPGHESARFMAASGRARLAGYAVFMDKGQSVALAYSVDLNRLGQTEHVHVKGWYGDRLLAIEIDVDERRNWRLDGFVRPELQGVDDIDLGFSPATNSLPLRRLRPALGSRHTLIAAWLRPPNFTLEPLPQSYERTGTDLYRYRSPNFTTSLQIDDRLFVVDYPNLWRVEQP